MGHHYIAKYCGDRCDHEQHIFVLDGVAYACFGYHKEIK